MRTLFLLCLFFSTNIEAARNPSNYSSQELEKLWNPTSDKEDKLFTSNPAHFWAWSSMEARIYLGDYLAYEGVVMGDPHPRNIFDYHKKTASLAVADIDDGGTAPLILDIARYIAYLEASSLNLKLGEIFGAYLRGLNGEADIAPDFVSAALAANAEKIKNNHEEWVNKVSRKETFDNKKLDLISKSEMNDQQKSDMNSLEKIVLEKSHVKRVFDYGYKENDSGSSAGMSRYWFLAGGEHKPKKIYEFKELGKPATEYFSNQESMEKRISSIIKIYSDGFDKDEIDLVKANGKYYWMRLKHIQIIDLDSGDFSAGELKAFALFMSNWIGLKQSKQKASKALAEKLNTDEKAKENMEKFVRAYLAELHRLNKKINR